MTYMFEPETGYVQDVSTINDDVLHGDEITYPGAGPETTDAASVTHTPMDTDSVFGEKPGRFDIRRVPRTPKYGRTSTFTVNVFGNNNPVPFIGKNINRARLLLWTDAGNTQPVSISGINGSVALAPGCIPIELYGFGMFSAAATANGILYVVEEDYYTNEAGE